MREPEEILDDFLFKRLGEEPPAERDPINFSPLREPDHALLAFLESYPGKDEALREICNEMTEEETEALSYDYMASALHGLIFEANADFLHPFFSDALRDELDPQNSSWSFAVSPEDYEQKKFLSDLLFCSDLDELWYPGETLDDAVEALQTRCDRIPFWPESLGLNLDFCPKEDVAEALVERAQNLQMEEVRTPEMQEAIQQNAKLKEAAAPLSHGRGHRR